MIEPNDMILPLLREMREEMHRRFEGVDGRFDEVDARLRAVETIGKTQREAFEGEITLGRYAAKEVEKRLSALEQDVQNLKRKI